MVVVPARAERLRWGSGGYDWMVCCWYYAVSAGALPSRVMNAARAVILGMCILVAGGVFFGVMSDLPDNQSDANMGDLISVLLGGFVMLSAAVIGAGALAGMSATESPAKTVTFPFQQQAGGAPPVGQPYPQRGTGPQQPVPQQYQPPQPPQ